MRPAVATHPTYFATPDRVSSFAWKKESRGLSYTAVSGPFFAEFTEDGILLWLGRDLDLLRWVVIDLRINLVLGTHDGRILFVMIWEESDCLAPDNRFLGWTGY